MVIKNKALNGINILNPVDIDKDYYLKAIEYAKRNNIDFIQINGPIHNPVKGNIDGMTFYFKYSRFNALKDEKYVEYCKKTVNECLEISHSAGIKTYMWHHELELPEGFETAYPETLNSDGDIEGSHPIVKDFLQNKIEDFFRTYPKMDGIVLTLHETRIPLLKLKNQKLGKTERVKYVTEILYNTCKSLGKELIVRPFASIEEDYENMAKAYSEIADDLIVMDKWTQFDWSLCLPNNRFFAKIRNPLMVETDIFGEYFGKGKLPIMLNEHIKGKYEYCEMYKPIGYCSRIDRAGINAFDTVNEVNYVIMQAVTSGRNVDEAIDGFFSNRYGEFGACVKEIMQDTEEIQKQIFYINGYYFTELSRFPSVNHSKNHFYFEIMRDNYSLKSNEWYIPKDWQRGSIESLIKEKQTAAEKSEKLFDKVKALKGKIADRLYVDLYNKFCNLYYVARVWQQLLYAYIYYVKAIDTDEKYEKEFYACLDRLITIKEEARNELNSAFYCMTGDSGIGTNAVKDVIAGFVSDIKQSYETEKKETCGQESGLTDYIVCGGALEGHNLRKEVNFSDTGVDEYGLYRIAGTNRGKAWSTVNAHGWFSYEIKVKPNVENVIRIKVGSDGEKLNFKLTIGGIEHIVEQDIKNPVTLEYRFIDYENKDNIEIRFDKVSAAVPKAYSIKIN